MVFFALSVPAVMGLVALVFGLTSLYEQQTRLDRAAQAVVMAAISNPPADPAADADAVTIMQDDLGISGATSCATAASVDCYVLSGTGVTPVTVTIRWAVAPPLAGILYGAPISLSTTASGL